MPFLDPSIMLLDPQLSSTFDVIERVQHTSDLGVVSIASTLVQDVDGVITPAKPNDLKQLDDQQHGNRTLVVITNHRLNDVCRSIRGNPPTLRQPDHILYDGDRYLVREVKPWTRYGEGWVWVLVTSIDSADAELRQ
jgi:hypothetical protein